MLHCEVLNRLRHEKPERKGKMKKFECRRTPVHILSTTDPKAGSVELCRRQSDHNDPEHVKSESRGAGISIIECEEDIESPSKTQKATTSADSSMEDSQNLYEPDSLTKVLSDRSTALPQVLISLSLEEEQLLDFDQCRRWLQGFPALARYATVQGVYNSNSTLIILSLPVVIWDWIPDDNACSFIGYVHSSNLLDLEQNKQGGVSQSEIEQKQDLQSDWKLPDWQMAPRMSSSTSMISNIQDFRHRVPFLESGSHAWTVHISLLPTRTQPFPFEKDTAAYKRCLSRGLHQIIVVPDLDGVSFKTSVDKAFSVNLRGRQWQPLVARLCDADGLRGLPMLRPLPDYLVGSDYNAEFLKHNCAVVDKNGKILDLYIAMSQHTISWAELKEATPFTPGLEAAWAYDPYLDGLLKPDTDNLVQGRRSSLSIESTWLGSSSGTTPRLLAQTGLVNALPLRPRSHSGGPRMYREDLGGPRTNDPVLYQSSDHATAPGNSGTLLKPRYQRPKHDRVFCQKCDSHPEGFRGEHELRRHQDRDHRGRTIKKWICIQPTDAGHPAPVVELSRCKSCKQQKKYGAYYNAAAHLRRAHFKPKTKVRGKSDRGDEIRGGKGGGDWPPMSEMKLWMKEVEEIVDDAPSSSHPELASSNDDVYYDMVQTQDEAASLAPSMANEPFSSGPFASSSMSTRLWDFEQPDFLKLDDSSWDSALPTIEGYSYERSKFFLK
jgi:hypothetical protein